MTSPLAALETLLPAATRMALDYYAGFERPETKVVESLPPRDLAQALDLDLPIGGLPIRNLLADAESVLRYSVRTGHPRFFNQLYGGYDPAGLFGEWVTALVNTSMYTFEAAPVATLLEQHLMAHMNRFVGFTNGEGILAPGGTISNLMAVLAARHRAFPEAKHHGVTGEPRGVVFLSDEAHYSIPRATSITGFGQDAALAVPTDSVGRMIPEELDRAIAAARAGGLHPFMVVATSGTTVPGAFDPIDAIADVTERHGLWLHVDGSYGGSVILSPAHRHLMQGVERADSVTWNPHKMMGLPLACSAILVKQAGTLRATNAMHADYLFHGDEGSSCDLGDMSLQCGRRVDAIKLWFSWRTWGDQGFAERVDRLMGLAQRFRAMLDEREGFTLIREPQGTNVCFRYLPAEYRALTGDARRQCEHDATLRIRRRLLESGRFMLNYATLDGAATFRIVMSNPRTTEGDLEALLDAIASPHASGA